MKKWILFLPALAVLVGPARAATVSFNQFSGLNTDDSPLTLTDGQTPDSENVVTDDGPGVQGRKGFIAYSTETSMGLWEFPLSNGTRYIITKNRNGSLKAATSSNPGAFTITIATVPTDRVTAATSLGDKFYFADTLNGLKYWDGTNTKVVGSTLTFSMLVTWKGRLAGAGVSGAERVIYLSRYLVGTDFTLETNATDDGPSQITVAGALDEGIQALYPSFQDKLVWFKKNSFGAIYGSRRSNFAQRTFSDSIGVASPETVRDCDGLLRWLGNNRIVWEFDGSTYKKISEPIDTLLATISQGDAASRSATKTSEADFEGGTQNPSGFLDTTTSPGAATAGATYYALASSAYTSSTSYDSTLYVDTQTYPGIISTVYPDLFGTFRDGTSGTLKVWDTPTDANVCDTGSLSWSFSSFGGRLRMSKPAANSAQGWVVTNKPTIMDSATSGTTYQFSISSIPVVNGSIYFVLNSTRALNSSSALDKCSLSSYASDPPFFWLQFDSTSTGRVALSAVQAKNAAGTVVNTAATENHTQSLPIPTTIQFWLNSSSYTVKLNNTLLASGSHTFPLGQRFVAFGVATASTTPSIDYLFDDFTVSPETFTFTQSADAHATTPIWDTFRATYTAAGISMNSQASADNSVFDSSVAAVSGSAIASARKRYVKLNAVFNYAPSVLPGTTQQLSDFSFGSYSTGTLVTTFNPGTNASAWGPATLNYSVTGATVSFEVSASSTGVFNSWTSIASGATPSVSTNSYVGIRATYAMNQATQTASVSDETVSWTEGSTVRAASAYFNNRYWLSVALGASSNNRILVFDKARQWQRYSGILADVFTLYNSALYFGSSSGIFQAEQTYADNGGNITAYYRTPTVPLNKLDLYGALDYLYLTTDSSASTMTTSYQVDGIPTDYTLGSVAMDATTGIQNFKVPFSMAEVQTAKLLNFKWQVVGTSFWRITNGTAYYQPILLPQ